MLNEDAEPAHLPLYLRIRRTIRSQIDSGAFTPGAAIPSESDLAQQYGTTKLTIRNAIDGLIDEGLLFRVQGKGTFVTHGLQANSSSRGPRGFRASQSDLQHHRACACSRRRFALRELTTPGCSRYRLKATYFR